MANELSFPGGFTNQKVNFAVGTSDVYASYVTNGQIDDNQFYVIKQGTQYFLYLGKNPIAEAAPVYDSSLSLTSNNAVQNKVVTQGLNSAVEVIKDENIETYQGGKFYYKADNLNPSLKFYISSLEAIDLLKTVSVVSTYSATDEANAITGKGVAAALKTLKLIDVDNDLPEVLENGAFYRVRNVENDTYALWFITASGTKLDLSNPVPTDHSDTDSKYGASTESKYGHAKSGIVVSAESTTLGAPYVHSNLDSDLVGSNVDSFARVDHKHPYPNFYQVASTSTTDGEKQLIAEMLLGSANTYSFIQKGTEEYKKNAEDKIIPANERLFALENDYISSNATTDQSIASKLTVAGNVEINSSSKLIAKTIESPKTTGSAYDGLTFNGPVTMSNGLSIADGLSITSGNISATASALTALSATLTGALSAAGGVSLGTNGNGLKITNPANSNEDGTVTSSYNWTFSGKINAGSITATSFNGTLNGTINSDSASFTGTVASKAYTIEESNSSYKWKTLLTLNFGDSNYYLGIDGSGQLNALTAASISTSTFTFNSKSLTSKSGGWSGSEVSSKYRLDYDGINVLTEQDLNDPQGLVLTWLNSKNYATQTQVNNLSDRITSSWNASDTAKIPTEAAVAEYLNSNYVPTSRIQTTLSDSTDIPTGAAVTAGIQGILATSISNTNSKAATPGAVQSYVSGLMATSISNSNSTVATPGAVQSYVTGLMATSLTNNNSTIPTSAAVYSYVTSMVTVSNTAPTGAYAGQLWIDTSLGNGVLCYYTGSKWQTTSAVWS